MACDAVHQIFFSVHLFTKWTLCRSDDAEPWHALRISGFAVRQIEPTINLKCVRADNFRANLACNVSRQVGLPGRSWADDKKCPPHLITELIFLGISSKIKSAEASR